jgi:hypothetical protein
MTLDEYTAERNAAVKDPVAYVRERRMFRLDEGNLPISLKGGWCRFWLFGIWPGSFLTAVITNDLFGAMAHADTLNRARLHVICSWFHTYGDTRAMKGNAQGWANRGGYFGLLRKEVGRERAK